MDIISDIKQLLASPSLSNKKPLYQNYDSQVMANSVADSIGGDAALVRIGDSKKAIAVSVDCNSRYVNADPYMGAIQAVIETYRNISAVGAVPMAITNCLNFGNPQKKEVMGQIVMAIKGITEASKKLKYPVISGNVSLYNETSGKHVLPTPAIGGVGLLDDISKRCDIAFKNEGDTLFLLGETKGHLASSIYASEILKIEGGKCPEVNIEQEKLYGEFIRNLINSGAINACHDISSGGFVVALLEMAMKSELGVELDLEDLLAKSGLNIAEFLFSEDQARYIFTAKDSGAVSDLAKKFGIECLYIVGNIAKTSESEVLFGKYGKIYIEEVKKINSFNLI